MLEVLGLFARVEGKEVLRGVEFLVNKKEVVGLMGANGSGKSSLANVLVGNTRYEVVGGKVFLDKRDLLAMPAHERALAGLFVAWQSPIAVPGVSVLAYLRAIYEANGKKIMSMVSFREMVLRLVKRVGLSEEVLKRNLNEGFSGGERKRFELLQLLLLQPKVAILDEIDSGLDVDGLKMVGEIVREVSEQGVSLVIITHYKRLFEYVQASRILVMKNGEIVRKGGMELVLEVEEKGYGGI